MQVLWDDEDASERDLALARLKKANEGTEETGAGLNGFPAVEDPLTSMKKYSIGFNGRCVSRHLNPHNLNPYNLRLKFTIYRWVKAAEVRPRRGS